MSHSAYERIKKCTTLPSPTGVALEILRLAGDEETSVDVLASVVKRDPDISGRLLNLVNSPMAGVSRTVASVSMAVKLLGLQTTKNLALGFSLLDGNREGPCKEFDYDAFWMESLARAVAARNIKTRRHRLRESCLALDEAFTVALLSKIGRLGLATVFPEAYTHSLTVARTSESADVIAAEREIFEIDHNQLSAEMMADWKLDDVLCEAVRRQDTPRGPDSASDTPPPQFAEVLHLAGSIAGILVQPMVRRESLAHLITEANGLGIGPDAFDTVFDTIRDEWRAAGVIFSVATRNTLPLAEIYTLANPR